MAVAKHRARAARMPNHMSDPAMGAPYCDCMAYVSHRNAPGAISAMAFMVSPVRPRVGFIFGCCSGPLDKAHLFHNRGRGEQPNHVRDQRALVPGGDCAGVGGGAQALCRLTGGSSSGAQT